MLHEFVTVVIHSLISFFFIVLLIEAHGCHVFKAIHQTNQTKHDFTYMTLLIESPPCSPFSCRHYADPGGAEQPGCQGPSEGVHSGTESGREVSAASEGSQGRGRGFRQSVPHAWPARPVKGATWHLTLIASGLPIVTSNTVCFLALKFVSNAHLWNLSLLKSTNFLMTHNSFSLEHIFLIEGIFLDWIVVQKFSVDKVPLLFLDWISFFYVVSS